MKKFVMLAVVMLAFCASLLAEGSWYVCLGSFRKQDNADRYARYLTDRQLSVKIADVCLPDGRVMHRVLQSMPYASYADAFDRRSKLQKEEFILKVGMRDLWVCRDWLPARGTGAAQADADEPIDSSVSHSLRLEPADARMSQFRSVPTWGDVDTFEDNFRFSAGDGGDFHIETDHGFDKITVTRYEFER